MDENKKRQLILAEVDLDDALHRFLDMEDMFERFLLQYADDDSINEIQRCLDNRDVLGLFKATHGMKGHAGNLGLKSIFRLTEDITELTRGKEDPAEVDFDKIEALVKELRETNEKLLQIIRL